MPFLEDVKTRDEYDELTERHNQFFSGGQLANPWEEEDDTDSWCEGWTGTEREW